jgi:hypothetical protein
MNNSFHILYSSFQVVFRSQTFSHIVELRTRIIDIRTKPKLVKQAQPQILPEELQKMLKFSIQTMLMQVRTV